MVDHTLEHPTGTKGLECVLGAKTKKVHTYAGLLEHMLRQFGTSK